MWTVKQTDRQNYKYRQANKQIDKTIDIQKGK